MIVPDKITAEIGWRVWRPWTTGIASPCCLIKNCEWLPGRRFDATCSSRDDHASPAPGCYCGIHATKTLDRLADYLDEIHTGDAVVGQVYLWGRVIEGEWGWKAEHAYPKNFIVCDSLICNGDTDASMSWNHGLGRCGFKWAPRLFEFGVPVSHVTSFDQVTEDSTVAA